MNIIKLFAIILFIIQCGHTASAKDTEITISIGPRGFGEMTPKLIEGFMKENPDIKVNWQKISDVPNESRKLYVTNFTAESSRPDIISVDVIWPGDFAKRGWIAPLNDLFTKEEISQFNQSFAEAAMVDGKLYAIPLYIDGTHLFYRADLLEKYGFKAPKTWEELISQSKTILEGEKNPDLVGFVNMWAKIEGLFMNWLTFFYGAGGEFFDEQGKISVNSPESIKAMQTMVDILYKHKIANESILTFKPNDARVLFQQERAVFLMVQDFVITPLSSEDSPVKEKFKITRNPYFAGNEKSHSTTIGGYLLAINQYSEHKEAAAKLIKYFTKYESQLESAKVSNKAPTINSVYKDSSLEGSVLQILGANYKVGVVRPSAETGERYNRVSQIMQTEITEALHQRKTPAEAMKDAENQIKRFLPKERR
jgi:multiple sugar transport system substrate-binding protein